MKTNFLVFAILILFISCNKDESTKPIPSKSLIGEWNWVSSSGGIAGIYYTPETTGYKRRIMFESDSTYKAYKDNALVLESKFHILVLHKIDGSDSIRYVTYDFTSDRQYYEIQSNGNLLLNDEFVDGYSNQFEKIQ